jgi:3-dehydroquinate synthase
MGLTVPVASGARVYPVHIELGDLAGLGPALRAIDGRTRAFLVSDDCVDALWGEAAAHSLRNSNYAVQRFRIPAGEDHKTVATWAALLDAWLEAEVDRRTLVVALGGGVVGDVVGFAAASALRGLDYVQVPTTLLAMVDSSVGGKTGVNAARGKNLIGAFHPPMLVYAALATLETLPERERRSGLGEVVKTGLVADAELFRRLEAEGGSAGLSTALIQWLVARCVTAKAEIVGEDERESGRRVILNAGHTVGHALEAALDYRGLLHGEAVGLGLVAELRYATRRGWCAEAELPARVVRTLGALGLPTIAPEIPLASAVYAMCVDKKAAGGNLRLPIPVRVGEAATFDLPVAEVGDLLKELPA